MEKQLFMYPCSWYCITRVSMDIVTLCSIAIELGFFLTKNSKNLLGKNFEASRLLEQITGKWILLGAFWVNKFAKYQPVHIVDLGHVLLQHIETLLDIFWIGLIDGPDAPTENQIRLTFFILKIKIIHTDKICVPLPPISRFIPPVPQGHSGRNAMVK